MGTTRHLICGIGNPGPRYAWTRHSVGLVILDELQMHFDLPRFDAQGWSLGESSYGPLALFKSDRLMNESGLAIRRAVRRFPSNRPIIVHDELELPPQRFKYRESGMSKGHNGLKSIMATLPGLQFSRLSVGIGRPSSREADVVSSYVLGKIPRNDLAEYKAGTIVWITKFLQQLRDSQGKETGPRL